MQADAWAAWAQWVTALIAGGAGIFAYFQVVEARKTRERVAQPDVVVYIDHHEIRRYMDLVVKNFGQTTAYSIRLILPPLKLVPFDNQLTGERVTTLNIPKSIAVLAPGQEWRTVWDSAVRRAKYKGELQTQFVGSVEFDDKMNPDKPSYCNPISLDTNMFWNTTWIERSESRTVKDALYDIAGTLKSYKQEHDGIWVYTVPGDEERQCREQEDNEQYAAWKRGYDELTHSIWPDSEPEVPNQDEPSNEDEL